MSLILGTLILVILLWYIGFDEVAAGMIGGVLGGVIGYWILRTLIFPWKARKIFDQQKSLHESGEFSWSEEGLSVKAETASSLTPWNNYSRWRENNDVFNLYHSDAIFQIFPKRLFSNVEEEMEFRMYLQEVKNA